MNNTQITLLIIFLPLALLKIFGFYQKFIQLSSEIPLSKVRKQLEKNFNLQDLNNKKEANP